VIDADRLERLIPAVEREVREARHRADHRAALEMLNESQARFDALASNLPACCSTCGVTPKANSASCSSAKAARNCSA
jgi:hypothetical protein